MTRQAGSLRLTIHHFDPNAMQPLFSKALLPFLASAPPEAADDGSFFQIGWLALEPDFAMAEAFQNQLHGLPDCRSPVTKSQNSQKCIQRVRSIHPGSYKFNKLFQTHQEASSGGSSHLQVTAVGSAQGRFTSSRPCAREQYLSK